MALAGTRADVGAGRVLTAPTMQAHNTFAAPDAVKPVALGGVTLAGGVLELRVPRHVGRHRRTALTAPARTHFSVTRGTGTCGARAASRSVRVDSGRGQATPAGGDGSSGVVRLATEPDDAPRGLSDRRQGAIRRRRVGPKGRPDPDVPTLAA